MNFTEETINVQLYILYNEKRHFQWAYNVDNKNCAKNADA